MQIDQIFNFPIPSFFRITSVSSVIAASLLLMFGVAGIACFVFLVYGGLKWLSSGGDSNKTKEARDVITNSLIGLALVAIALAIMTLIGNWIGVDFLNVTLPVGYS